jgi:LPXTG-motif cell wall-anchored protein
VSTQLLISPAAAASAARNAGLAPVTPAAPGQVLARTGHNNGGLIKIGVLLLAIGAGAVLITRKHRAQV